MSTLFDPSEYGEGTPRRAPSGLKAYATGPQAETNAVQDGTWVALGRRAKQPDGPLHRLINNGDAYGLVVTVCGLDGYAIGLERELPLGHPILACGACLEDQQ